MSDPTAACTGEQLPEKAAPVMISEALQVSYADRQRIDAYSHALRHARASTSAPIIIGWIATRSSSLFLPFFQVAGWDSPSYLVNAKGLFPLPANRAGTHFFFLVPF